MKIKLVIKKDKDETIIILSNIHEFKQVFGYDLKSVREFS